jgi:hypothetical protein
MKSLIKKTALVLAFSSAAVAATVLISVDQVNQKVAALTAPYNNDTTKMSMSFTALNIDDVRTLDFGVQARVQKVGPANKIDLNLSNVTYQYGNGVNPTVTGKLVLKTDLVKLAGQEALNAMVEDFQDMAKNAMAEYTQQYGNAVKVKAIVDNVQRDANNNVLSARVRISAVLDFNKLPGDLALESVDFKRFDAVLAAGVGGVSGSVKVVLNPWNRSFKSDQNGLKEYVQALLNDDQEAYQNISQILDFANGLAESVVNHDSSAQ